MSGRKNVLAPYHFINAHSLGATFSSSPTNIQFLDNTGIQLNWTGTPTGVFTFEVSADYSQDSLGNVVNAGQWVALNLSPAISASGSADSSYVDLNQLSSPWIRVTYTRTSGTGTVNGYLTAKMV